jgi:hypothetical protein
MNEPKLHHYVPRFYLNNFRDPYGYLWVYDKQLDRLFRALPNRIAAENQFYRLPERLVGALDPLYIEKSLSDLESRACRIFSRLVAEIGTLSAAEHLTLSDDERLTVSEFLAVQHFRTLELKDLMLYLLEDAALVESDLSAEERKEIHFQILSGSGLLEELEESIYRAIWIFAKNESESPLITSDHPICMKTSDNRMWIKGLDPLQDGSYLVFPMAPKLVLYCKEPIFWSKLNKYDLCVSPVKLDSQMVHHENCGQAFMASRFLVSCTSDFREVQNFIPSIGTSMYAPAPVDADRKLAVERTAIFGKRRVKQK